MPPSRTTKQHEIEVQILDRPYRLACEPDEKPLLLECVGLVDTRMRQIKQNSRLTGTDRIAVMVALTLARELLVGGQSVGLSESDLKARLQSLIDLTEDALAPQEKLFD